MFVKAPPRSFLALLWESADATHIFAFGFVGLSVAFLAWYFLPKVCVPIILVVLLGAVWFILVVILGHAALKAFHFARKPLPAIRAAKSVPRVYSQFKALLFVEPSDLFSTGSLVSLYLIEDGEFELLFGVGEVLIVQESGLIQVGLRDVLPEHADSISKLLANDATFLKNLRVKPSVPRISFSEQESSE